MLLGIKWYQFVRNDDVRRLMKQPKLTAIIQSRRLTIFAHIMRMDDNADAKRILLASPSGSLEKTTRSSPQTPPYAPRSSKFGSEQPSVEDDVDVWRYAIVSCMPETTTTSYQLSFSHIITNIIWRISKLIQMAVFIINTSSTRWPNQQCHTTKR